MKHFIKGISYYHDQADAATMGSSLGPILANIFIDYHKKEWLNNYDGISLSTLCTMSI